MKTSEKLYNISQYFYEKNRKKPTKAVLHYEDFRKLLSEPESQMNFIENTTGKYYAGIRLFRTADIKQGDIQIF